MTAIAMLMKEIESLPQECVEELLHFTIFLKKRKNIRQAATSTEPKTRDYEYSAELEAQDPFFNRATQAELARRAREMDAGINCAYHELVED